MSKLALVRNRIDEIDRQIVALLDQRFTATRQAAAIKALVGIPIIDPNREGIVVENAVNRAHATPSEAIRAIYAAILHESREDQRRLID